MRAVIHDVYDLREATKSAVSFLQGPFVEPTIEDHLLAGLMSMEDPTSIGFEVYDVAVNPSSSSHTVFDCVTRAAASYASHLAFYNIAQD